MKRALKMMLAISMAFALLFAAANIALALAASKTVKTTKITLSQTKTIKLKGYTTLYLGYPIWWGMAPRIMCTFVERYNFAGITVIPFCTSGSSGIGDSGDELARLAGTGTWLKGARHSGSISEKELRAWVEGLK